MAQAKSWSTSYNNSNTSKGPEIMATLSFYFFFFFCERPPHTMANAIRARGIATFLKCSQKQHAKRARGERERDGRKGPGGGAEKGHKLAKTSWKSFGQQAVAALFRHGRRRLGLSVGQNFPAYVCHIYAWAARARAALSECPGRTRTCGYWGNTAATPLLTAAGCFKNVAERGAGTRWPTATGAGATCDSFKIVQHATMDSAATTDW